MGFVEHDGMGDSTLNAATEHLLVDVVKREHRDGSLHTIVLRRMNSQDGGRIRRQQTPLRTARFEDAVIVQLIEPNEHVLIAFGILLEQLVKGEELRNLAWAFGLLTPPKPVVRGYPRSP